MKFKQRQKPCQTCPFTANCEPGELGGSPVETFIGQTVGPFRIPCHEQIDYSDPNWKTECWGTASQCVGNAMFRFNVGVSAYMPGELLMVEPTPEDKVFESFQEFVQHHHPEMPAAFVAAMTSVEAIKLCCLSEMSSSSIQILKELKS